VLKQAQPLIVNAVFRAMEIYSLIRFGRPGQPRSLDAFFDQQENIWSSLSHKLDAELTQKDKQRGF
jgi:hypothetical protein